MKTEPTRGVKEVLMLHARARRHLVLRLLGVTVDQVVDDDPRGNGYILPTYQRHIDAFFKGGGDPEIPTAILGVKEEYLDTAFEEIQTTYGNIDT